MDFAVNVESAFSPMILRRFNTWYSVNDGNWSDPNTWMSNRLDKKIYTSPQPGDNVYVNHNVTLDYDTPVNNIYGNGYLSISAGVTLTVNGDMQITGTVDQTAASCNIFLNGYNNLIVNYNASTTSKIIYNGFYAQSVMPLTYGSLTTQNSGKKYLSGNITVTGILTIFTNLECLAYNLTVNGATKVSNTNVGSFSKSGAGNILFIGAVDAATAGGSTIDFSVGNPTVEFRGGFSFNSYLLNTGTGQWKFSTNNQSITCSGSTPLACPILISGAITVTVNGSNYLPLGNTITGDNAASTLNNNTRLYLYNTTVPMATGVFNYMNLSTSILGYTMNGTYTLPYTTYAGLYIGGTGVKTLGGNTSLSYNLEVATNLECSTFNLTVNGTTKVSNTNVGTFSKSGAGSIVFVGNVDANNSGGGSSIDFSGGNPTVEFQGGFTFNCFTLNTGTGQWSFTTNNQSIACQGAIGLSCSILVSGITLTANGTNFLPLNGVLNGTNTSSIFINLSTVRYSNATAPMATGKLYCNQSTNTFTYSLAGNQDITVPSDPVSPGYKNLTLNGSGAKKLLGNVSVKGVYTLTGPATLNSNGFALTNP